MATYKITKKFVKRKTGDIGVLIDSKISKYSKLIYSRKWGEVQELPYIYEQRYDYMDPTSILPNSFHFDFWDPATNVFKFRTAFMKIRNDYFYSNYGEDPNESLVEKYNGVSYLQDYTIEQMSDKQFCLDTYNRIVSDWNRVGMEVSDYEHEQRSLSDNEHYILVAQNMRWKCKIVLHVMHIFRVIMQNIEKLTQIHEQAKQKIQNENIN